MVYEETRQKYNDERREDKELSKSMLLEVERVIEKTFDKFTKEMRLMFMSKEECNKAHDARDMDYSMHRKLMYTSLVLSIVAICIACVAVGMRIQDVLMKLVGSIS